MIVADDAVFEPIIFKKRGGTGRTGKSLLNVTAELRFEKYFKKFKCHRQNN